MCGSIQTNHLKERRVESFLEIHSSGASPFLSKYMRMCECSKPSIHMVCFINYSSVLVPGIYLKAH